VPEPAPEALRSRASCPSSRPSCSGSSRG
jgi:hypothetical protein